MGLFNRLAATVVAGIEESVNQIENHDAVIEASLKEARQAASKASVRLGRVKKDGEKMRSRLDKLIDEETRWAERARAVAATDEARALECVRRRRDCQQRIESTAVALQDQETLEQRLNDRLRQIESRLQEIAQTRNQLRSRESVAEANRHLRDMDADIGGDIDATLERWEVRVGVSEYADAANLDIDTLDAEFTSEEDAESLKAELEDLLDDDRGTA